MISLKLLLQNTPISDDTRKKLLADLPEMNDVNKFKLEMLCWETLAEINELQYQLEKARLLKEVEDGKRVYNPNDLTELKVKIYHELATKLEHGKSKDQIEEVRKQLEKYKSQKNVKN